MNPAAQLQPEPVSESSLQNNDPRDTRFDVADPSLFVTELKYRDPANLATGKFATGLGIFSLALGLAELLAPRQLGKAMGVDERFQSFLPALGLREIASGIAILGSSKPTAAVWSRVGGDAIDLAFLGAAFFARDSNKARLVGATAAVAGAGALDLLCAQQLSSQDWTANTGNPAAPTNVGQPSARHPANTAIH